MSFKGQSLKKSGLLLSASVLALASGIVVSADESGTTVDNSVPVISNDTVPSTPATDTSGSSTATDTSNSGAVVDTGGTTDNTSVPSTEPSTDTSSGDTGSSTTPSTPATDGTTTPSTSTEESSSETTPTTVTEGTTATNTQPTAESKTPTTTASQAYEQGQTQVGTVSEVTHQIVSDVSYDAPVVTQANETIVGVVDGQLQILDTRTGTVTSKSASEVEGATENADKTISVTDKDGNQVTLPNTGDRISFLLALFGVILVGFGLLKLPKRQVQQDFLI